MTIFQSGRLFVTCKTFYLAVTAFIRLGGIVQSSIIDQLCFQPCEASGHRLLPPVKFRVPSLIGSFSKVLSDQAALNHDVSSQLASQHTQGLFLLCSSCFSSKQTKQHHWARKCKCYLISFHFWKQWPPLWFCCINTILTLCFSHSEHRLL